VAGLATADVATGPELHPPEIDGDKKWEHAAVGVSAALPYSTLGPGVTCGRGELEVNVAAVEEAGAREHEPFRRGGRAGVVLLLMTTRAPLHRRHRHRGGVRRAAGEEAADPEWAQLDSDGEERKGGEEREGVAPTTAH
jgi:hypothetical protein